VTAPRVLQITDAAIVGADAILTRLGSIARLGPDAASAYAVQLRDPALSTGELLALARRLRDATRAAGALLVINDRVDLALAVDADGVHLGRRSITATDARSLLPRGAWISRSCHAVEEVVVAAREGADAAVLSPIFASPGKGAPLGLEAIRQARRAAGRAVQIIALGGVDRANAAACFEAGADAVASIRADLAPFVTPLVTPLVTR
jgi:thiamine-phosphate pyrophosphorylase